MTRIVLADDHAMFRQSLSALLHSQEGIEVAGEAADGDEALRLIEATQPDVAVLDISMPGPGGLEIAQILKKQGLPMKVLLLTMLTGPDLVQQAVEAGAHGFLLKENTFDELMTALNTVVEGGTYVSPAVAPRLSSGDASGNPNESRLTPREQEVLKNIASGLSNKKIAKILHISVKTVETHRTHIMQKLNIHTTADLVRYAMLHGLI
jgi:DNA-binding NarL/FixJ family response regulator